MLNERHAYEADENVRTRFDESDEADERGESGGSDGLTARETIIKTPIFTALNGVLISPK